MSVKNTVVIVVLYLIFSSLFSFPLYAKERETNEFDINKVHDAIASDGLDSIVRSKTGVNNPAYLQKEDNNYFFLMIRIVAYVLILTLVIIAGVWVIKKLGFAGSSRLGGGAIDLLEALPVGQNRSITLVRVMDSVLVLGQTVQNITLLEKIEGEKAVELIASTKGGTDIVQFKDVFNTFIGKMKKTK